MTVAFLQPFGVHAPGGGPRILRAMLERRTVDAVSICMSPAAPPPSTVVREVHERTRPSFGRLDATRLNRYLGASSLALERRVARRIERRLADEHVDCVHLVAHDGSLWPSFLAARRLGLPVVLSVHDHLRYTMRGRPEASLGVRRLDRIWSDAHSRWAITSELGDHYGQLLGARPYGVLTDGLERVHPPRPTRPDRCTVYFMGAFHNSYRANLEALLRGMGAYAAAHPEVAVRLKLRCGALPPLPPTDVAIELRPFAEEAAIERDLDEADLLWLPLPFGEEHDDFVRYSLSTKMVTYLGSGVPILYHGPGDAAAARLLEERGAGGAVTSLDGATVAAAIARTLDERAAVTERAGRLAEERFLLDDLASRFWNAMPATTGHR